MRSLGRHLRVIAHLLRASIQAQAQYRLDFVLQFLLALFWAFWNVAPLWLVFRIRPVVAGWSFEEAMLVMAFFLVLKALLDGVITPNLTALVESVRTGAFDFVLLKPLDAQVLVSFSKIQPAKLIDLVAGVAMIGWALAEIDPPPPMEAVFAGVLLALAGALSIYAIWVCIVSTAFWLVKVDNLSFLFTSIFDAARWPITVFRGWVRALLTFVLPVALMTSFPAMAVIGKLAWAEAGQALLTTLVLFATSRVVWRWALSHYASASS